MKHLFIATFFLIPFIMQAQSGTVIYEKKITVPIDNEDLGLEEELAGTGIDLEELKDLLASAYENQKPNKTKLIFDEKKSLYTSEKAEEDVQKYNEDDTNISITITLASEAADETIYTDLEEGRYSKQTTFFGKKFLVKDDVYDREWKIINEHKLIQGHLCFKAELNNHGEDKLVIWFDPKVKIPFGPEGINDAPGLVLGYEVEDVLVLEAVSVDLETPIDSESFEKPRKGKVVTAEKMNAIIEKKKGRNEGESQVTTIESR